MSAVVFNSITFGNPANPAVIFLHGFMGNAHDWSALASQLSEQYYCICLDLPGHGKTSHEKLDNAYDISHVAKDITEFCRENELAHPALVGYSMGGRIALEILHSSPDSIRCAVLESASPGLENEGERAKRIKNDQQWSEKMRNLPTDQFLSEWYNQPVFESLSENDQLRGNLIQARHNNFNSISYAWTINAFSTGKQQSLWTELPQISCSVQLIVGQKDRKFCSIAERITDLLPNVEIHEIENAGHIVHLEQPDHFVTTIKTFLAKQLS